MFTSFMVRNKFMRLWLPGHPARTKHQLSPLPAGILCPWQHRPFSGFSGEVYRATVQSGCMRSTSCWALVTSVTLGFLLLSQERAHSS